MQIMLKCQDTTQIQYIYHCINLSTGIQVHDMHAYNNHWALKKKIRSQISCRGTESAVHNQI